MQNMLPHLFPTEASAQTGAHSESSQSQPSLQDALAAQLAIGGGAPHLGEEDAGSASQRQTPSQRASAASDQQSQTASYQQSQTAVGQG